MKYFLKRAVWQTSVPIFNARGKGRGGIVDMRESQVPFGFESSFCSLLWWLEFVLGFLSFDVCDAFSPLNVWLCKILVRWLSRLDDDLLIREISVTIFSDR